MFPLCGKSDRSPCYCYTMQLTQAQQRRLERTLRTAEGGALEVARQLFELEDRLESTLEGVRDEIGLIRTTLAPSLKDVLDQIKGRDGETPTDERLVSLIKPLIPVVKDGKDYVLTDKDRRAIANAIKVPVVEKVVERTEVVRELPTVTEVTKEVVREVAVSDTAAQVRDKLESLEGEDRIDAKAVKNLPQATKEVIRMMGGGNVEVFDGNAKVGSSQRIKFTGATVTNAADGAISVAIGAITASASEAPDGSRTSFTFSRRPAAIVVDQGRTMREGAGWSWSGSQATLDVAPEFDIFAL